MARPTLRALLLAPGLVGLLPLLAACDNPVMNPAGEIARQQRDLIGISTALMLLIIVPVMILTVVFAWRYRAGNEEATYDPDFDHSTTLELVIWSAPLLIIIALGALTWSSTHELDPFRRLDRAAMALTGSKAPDIAIPPMRIEVVALDWKWLFIYPEQGIATVNELALPVGREVRFDLTSSNMMNTFYVPTLAGMIYTMPGMQSTLHAVLNRPVVSEGFSANYSGHGFSDMRFKVFGLDQAGFDGWVAKVKGGGGALATPAYLKLVEPSEKVPPMRFAAVQPDLFRRIVERCVEPGKPCMSDVMHRDRAVGGGHPHDMEAGSGMPQGRDAAPPHGEKPEGALFKEPDPETGKSRDKPVPPEQAPGVTDPGSPKNRGLSVLTLPAGVGETRPRQG
ncbi:MAG: ubiquinol oxidase subunit II [Novosphingobium sp.]